MRAARAIGLTLVLVGACRDASTPWRPTQGSDATGVVPGQYIVVFRDTVADPEGLAQALVQAQGGTRLHTYTSALKGFAARLSDPAVAALRQNPRVAYVEPDQKGSVAGPQALQRIDQRALPRAGTAMSASANPLVAAAPSAPTTQQMDAQGNPWGLDRIDQRTLPFSGTYTYTSTGAGVHVYFIDTGIWTAHPEFQGRADNIFDFAGGDGTDCFGSGTAVAGVVGAVTYGVAKGVFLHGLRTYDCNGAGFRSDIVAGVDWVTAHHASPAVADISVSLDPSPALTTAVHNLWNSGVFVVTTAANHNADACSEAGGASGAFTVAASTGYDTKADWSNWGTCVQIYAPGDYIQSTWLAGQTNIVSGTSYAAAFVSGVAATYKATVGDAPPDAVASWILNNATAGVVTENTGGTPNLLLYSAAVPVPAPVADFTANCAGLACSFDPSSSTAQATATYSWSWGDGTPAGSGTLATHTYAAAGTYNVTLTVTDAGGTSKTTRLVTVSPPNQPPVASFTKICSLLACKFTSTSSDPDGTIASYSWTFGDGGTSPLQNPSHSYAAGGSYTVTLTVTDNLGATNSTSQSVTVTPNRPPVVNTGPDQANLIGLFYTETATFSDPDNNGPWSYTITWGDGSSSTGTSSSQGTISASHTYLLGRYVIRVTVTDNDGASGSDSKVVTFIL